MATKRTSSSTSPVGMRRQPTQERARQTIEAIFGATAQIVEHDGDSALTTNRIAQVAGVSIGTLYQYFPSRESVLLAMVERERERVQRELQQMLDDALARQRPVRDVLQDMVGLLVSAFGTGGSRACGVPWCAWAGAWTSTTASPPRCARVPSATPWRSPGWWRRAMPPCGRPRRP
ncbi:TetR/AcrR family transcriptional regulator [Paracidovorax cattleyae]|uniref:TetR/AcrR family transcriptional regulator n=1 Tax=Paracidovorax cattleyae TaxID=80868 RepID=UPI001E384008|nr:TetR/AcrR family transcriptional regulator [Paracidovorax cattleyae]